MALNIIRLELARGAVNPVGDAAHGYEFYAPLTADGRLDMELFRHDAQLCTVRHFRPDADDERGQLIRTKAGGWAFSYAVGDEDDEPIYRLSTHVFRPGEYVTITEHDHTARTFRVASVRKAPLPARFD
jgi:hypothetical protein